MRYVFLLLLWGCHTFAQMETKIIAHRGAWKEFGLPQNSVASLQKAIDIKCFGSEFDVHLTKDGVVVVNHDHDFYGTDIETAEYTDLLKIKHPNGESIPTLEEYFKVGLKQHETKLILEIKTSRLGGSARTMEMVNTIVKLLPNGANPQNLEFILFDFVSAVYTKKMLPKYQVHYLNGDKTAEEVKAAGLDGMDYHYKLLLQDKNIIGAFRLLQLKTNSWTVNDEETAKLLMSQGIDCITTDIPAFFKSQGL